MASPLLIRPALPTDKIPATELILSSMGSMADIVFGFGDYQRALKAMGAFFLKPGNRFSCSSTSIAELEGQIAGALLAYPGNHSNKLMFSLAGPLLKEYGVKDTIRLAVLMLNLSPYKENEPDEFYIAHLATLEQFRGKGVGSALLEHAQKLAGEVGFTKCSLIVEIDNENARRLYSKHGYTVVETILTPKMNARFHVRGFERRVRSFSQA